MAQQHDGLPSGQGHLPQVVFHACFSVPGFTRGLSFYWTEIPVFAIVCPMDRSFKPVNACGNVLIPGSKSQTIRALLIATLSGGKSIIENALDSQDTVSCIDLCRQLGAEIHFNEGHTTLFCDASHVFDSKEEITVDCGNSGTTLTLAAGMVPSLARKITFTGDNQLQNRPVGALLQALEDLGAKVERHNGEYPPFSIQGPLKGGTCTISCPTSQYLSALLLGSPLSLADTEIHVPLLYEKPYVALTLGWMEMQGINYEISPNFQHAKIKGNQHYHPITTLVTGDFSSASFFFCMAAISKSTITVDGLDFNDVQGDKKILDILQEMGCTIVWNGNSVSVTGNDSLHGGSFDLNEIPDTLPALAVTACFASDDVHLTNVPQARIKETDRIAVMNKELTALGASIEESPDGMTIKAGHPLHGGIVHGHDDHRVIMALSMISCAISDTMTIQGIDAAGVTFPSFFPLFDSITGENQ